MTTTTRRGLTLSEIARELSLDYEAARYRVSKLAIRPCDSIGRTALYPASTVDLIRADLENPRCRAELAIN